jgi:ribonuclease HII
LHSSPTGLPIGSDSSEIGAPAGAGRSGGASTEHSDAAAPAKPAKRSDGAAPAKPGKRSARTGRRLFAFDRSLGTRFVAGADEAGRGCLAGPLVAAAVLFDLQRIGSTEIRVLGALNDSKQQSPEGRAELYPLVLRVATKVAIVSRCAPGIDSRGLHVTNLAALCDALRRVAREGCICLSDGFPVAGVGHQQQAVIGGDAKSAAIAAASVLAKETRDRYMRRADLAHPGWQFAQHVGYATPEHREAIERLGVTPLHRMSFQSAAYQQLAL